MSCPSRGTWIEIWETMSYTARYTRRAPRGARGLKCSCLAVPVLVAMRRAPRGARGLKYVKHLKDQYLGHVVPLAGHVD